MVRSPVYASNIVLIQLGTSFVSRLGLGACADRYNPWTLALSTLSAASACVFLLWGVLSTNVAGLVAFGLAYGLVAGGWSSLWSGFLRFVHIYVNPIRLLTEVY
jgi:MCP family monocarboxylic acid transporter-like MFS transporter 10